MSLKLSSLPPPPVVIGGGAVPVEADAPPARILMVDDHPPNLVALDAILEPLGQDLVHATSGEEALRHLLENDVALILMDVQMPGLDGLATAKLIKERPRNKHVPIIFLTAIQKDPAYIFRGYKEGAVDYLLKPFDPEILRAKVSVFVDLWRKNELLRRQQALLRARELIEVERRSEMRFRVLTDSMPQCVWAAKPDGEIYYCNQVWSEYAGESAGITFFDAVPEGEQQEVRASFREAVRSGQPLERQQRLRRKDGEWRWHLCRMVPERDERGRVGGWICTATDIDEQKRVEEANKVLLASEQEARRQAEIANRTKDEFLATVSHELRTPLNAILGWTRMLRTGAVEPKALARVLETIERNARSQTQLVDDILDVSRIIAGKLRVNIQKIDLHAVARAALDAVRPAAEAKGVALIADLQPGSDEFCGDPDRIQQVIWNLLSNAIKFTPREGTRRAAHRAAALGDATHRAGHRRRHRAALPAAGLQPLLAGRQLDDPRAGRAGPGARHRPPPRRGARRHGERRVARAKGAGRSSRCACRCARWLRTRRSRRRKGRKPWPRAPRKRRRRTCSAAWTCWSSTTRRTRAIWWPPCWPPPARRCAPRRRWKRPSPCSGSSGPTCCSPTSACRPRTDSISSAACARSIATCRWRRSRPMPVPTTGGAPWWPGSRRT